LRVEIGPRDLADDSASFVRRLSGGRGALSLRSIGDAVTCALEEEQTALLAQARARRDERIVDVDTLDDARAAAESGWARVPWDRVGTHGEAELATTGVSVRCLTRGDGSVPESEAEPDLVAYIARAY